MRVVLCFLVVLEACGGVLDRHTFKNQIIEQSLINLQLKGGSLTSFKTSALYQSPWEIGPLGDSLEKENSDIGFYRIIGCPLPPRHNASQLWTNLKYVVQNEPPLERAKKIFVLNRLPPDLDAQVRDYLESKGFEAVSLAMDADEYDSFKAEDSYGLDKKTWEPYLTDKFSRMNARLYVMNNNGARNFALRLGLMRGYAWTLPFDGNCMFDAETWSTFLKELDEAKRTNKSYVAIPLVRTLAENGTNLVRSGVPGEHQVAFGDRSSAKIQFDPTQPYGHRPKVNLLWRLGVPGSWDYWTRDAPFRAEAPCELQNHRECGRTWPKRHPKEAPKTIVSKTSVLRLPDGVAKVAVGENSDALTRRAELRDAGTIRKIQEVDDLKPNVHIKPFVKPLYFNVMSMESMRRECACTKQMFSPFQSVDPYEKEDNGTITIGSVAQHHCSQIDEMAHLALLHLDDDLYSVADKAQSLNYDPPRGASVRDYQSIGPYDYQLKELPQLENMSLVFPEELSLKKDLKELRRKHPSTFVEWTGHVRNDLDEDQFDKRRSEDMMSNLTMHALTYFFAGKIEHAEKATAIARQWFVSRTVGQTPHMKFARGKTGILAFKDIAYTLDALSLVTPTSYWTDDDASAMTRWCSDYLSYLDKSNEKKANDHRGWYYLTQSLAVAKCAGKNESFLLARLRRHAAKYAAEPFVEKNGFFSLEPSSHDQLHYHFFTSYAIVLAWRAASNLGSKEIMTRISEAVKPTMLLLDQALLKAPSCDRRLTSTRELWQTRFSAVQKHTGNRTTVQEIFENPGCFSLSAALEYAAPLCQWAFDDNALFARRLSMCRRRGHPENALRPAPPPKYPILGTSPIERNILPPLLPTVDYFPFTNLMW